MGIIKRNYLLLVLLVVSFIPLLPLFGSGLPLTHDGQDHVARIANFYQSLSEGNIVPRWAANLNWGYGHPILMFLYPLPSYIASSFHFLGFDFIDSVKLVFGVTFVLSAVTMYLWVRNIAGEYGAIIAGVVYAFAPYRFVDFYVRGAIGEHVAFVFPPLILYFLFLLSKKYSRWYLAGGVFSFAGLILSHNAITIMFLPFIVFYGILLVLFSKQKYFLLCQYILVLVLGVGISSFFLLPAFLEGKYTLRDIVTENEYSSRFVNPVDFILPSWSYGGTETLSKQIGSIQLLLIVASLISLFKIKGKEKLQKILYISIFIFFLLSLFVMTSYSDFIWKMVTLLQKFQFPWRFLSVVVFTSAVLAAFTPRLIPDKYKKYFTLGVVIVVVVSSIGYWNVKGYLQKPSNYFSGIYEGTTDTGESAPIWSVRFMEKKPNKPIEIIEGEATITATKRTSTEHSYTVDAKETSRIRENTLYFPGWNVYVDKKPTDIEFQDQLNRGLITFFVPPGRHTIEVLFKDTKLRVIATLISAASFIVIIFFMVISMNKIYSQKK